MLFLGQIRPAFAQEIDPAVRHQLSKHAGDVPLHVGTRFGGISLEIGRTHLCIADGLLVPETRFLVNPSGRFVLGGPAGDSGVTGRKIIVDTYGGVIPHGGGAFSGKDATKVDRSASYYARYVCKNMVAAGAADKLELQVAYAIGKANPVSLYVDSFGTGKVSDARLLEMIRELFDFRPYSIIECLGLRRPIYSASVNYGHFGKPDMPWERTDRTEDIKKLLDK